MQPICNFELPILVWTAPKISLSKQVFVASNASFMSRIVKTMNSYSVSWEPEGRYQYSMMFRWEPEGRYCCKKPMAIAPFWFSTEHGWTALTPFWFSADESYNYWILSKLNSVFKWFSFSPCTLKMYGDCFEIGQVSCRLSGYPRVTIKASIRL